MTTEPNAKIPWRNLGVLGVLAVRFWHNIAPYLTVYRPYMHRIHHTVLSEKIALSPFIHRLNGG
jgi:hypothetical protein